MKFPLAVTLQTKVGRRIALLFVVSALLPVGVLAVEGYLQVRDQLMTQTTAQLEQAAKNVGMGVIDQLRVAEATLQEMAGEMESGDARRRAAAIAGRIARQTFESFAVVDRSGTRVHWGQAPLEHQLTPTETRLLADGRRVLVVQLPGPRVWIVAALAGGAQAWAEVEQSHIFRGADDRARNGDAETNLCIRSVDTPTPLYCPPRTVSQDALSARWDLFLGYSFGAPPWRVDVAESITDALAPVKAFRRTFVLSMILIFGLVIWLSSVQVRRSLQPLTALGEGTRRLAQRDFSGTVSVSSEDEFEELAGSFNRMASEMDQHFRTMTAVNVIDQAALAARPAEQVAATAAGTMRNALRGVSVDVFVAGERARDAWSRVRASEDAAPTNGATQGDGKVNLPAADLERLRAAGGKWLPTGGEGFDWLSRSADRPVVMLPLTTHDELVGVVALHSGGHMPDERLVVARQLADQLTVGISHARLIGSLNGLSYGALSALARTVDANSPWTAGHSERVTAMSLRLANQLGLSASEVRTLYRGGLLHDIGKIGVPTYIIDLAGPLSPEEKLEMRKHPALGAKILAPIAAFADAIPIVLYHHERIDGAGYPEQLKGKDIPYLARLLSVADVYDALVSDRPYRAGWATELAVQAITSEVGAGFDAEFVDALLAVMKDEGDAARFAAPPPELASLPQ